MECSTFRVQKLLNKYTPKLLEGDASRHREIEIGKLDLLEEKLWAMIDEDYYTVSNGQVVYLETGDPVPDIDPIMKIARKSVVEGKSVSVRVDLGVRRINKRETTNQVT